MEEGFSATIERNIHILPPSPMTNRFVLMLCASVSALTLSVVTQATMSSMTAQVYSGPGLEAGIGAAGGVSGTSGQDLPQTIISVIDNVLTYVALAAVIGIIVAGLYMILTGGAQADRAKQIIIWIVVGLFVVLLAKVIVNTVYDFLGASAPDSGVGGNALLDGDNIFVVATVIVNNILDYVALFAVIAIIIAGLYMILTGGAQADRAKQIIIWTIIGLVVILLAKVIVLTIYSFLGAENPNIPGVDALIDDDSPRTAIVRVVNSVLTFVGLAAIIAIIVAGLYLILGFGSESAKDRAKQIVIYTLIGLVLIVLAKMIVALPVILLT
jgi:type IV secretory pathway VirB2 component (pilin)